MKHLVHYFLSEEDFKLLAGTPTMERMQSNRVVVVYGSDEKRPSDRDLGLYELTGPLYVRKIDATKFEYLFSKPVDRDNFLEALTVQKLTLE